MPVRVWCAAQQHDDDDDDGDGDDDDSGERQPTRERSSSGPEISSPRNVHDAAQEPVAQQTNVRLCSGVPPLL